MKLGRSSRAIALIAAIVAGLAGCQAPPPTFSNSEMGVVPATERAGVQENLPRVDGNELKSYSLPGMGFVSVLDVPTGTMTKQSSAYSIDEGGQVTYYLIAPCNEKIQYLYAYHEVADMHGYHWEEVAVYDLTDHPTGNYCGPGIPSPTPMPTSTPTSLEFTLALDEQVAYEDGAVKDLIVQDIAPLIKITFNSPSVDVDPASVTLSFPTRRDGVTPAFLKEEITRSGSTFEYRVPFTEESVLFAGDQFVTVNFTDNQGKAYSKIVPFAVGARTLYSGTPVENAYRVLGKPTVAPVPEGEITYEPDWVKKARAEGKKVIRLRVSFVPEVLTAENGRLIASQLPNAYVWVVRAAVLTTPFLIPGDTYYFLDSEPAKTPEEAIKRRFYRIDTGYGNRKPGLVQVDGDTFKHLHDHGHGEITADILARTLISMKEDRANWELWSNPKVPSVRKPDVELDEMVVTSYKNNLYRLVLQKRIADPVPRIHTGFVAGPLWTNKALQWPNPLEQWSDIVDKVARFSAKENRFKDHKLRYLDIPANDPRQPNGIYVWQWSQGDPEYPLWMWGDIVETRKVNHKPLKPYAIDYGTRIALPGVHRYILNLDNPAEKNVRPIGPFVFN